MNILKYIIICVISITAIGCELNVTDTQYIDIKYYDDNNKNKKLAEDLIYYDTRYIASKVPLLNEKTGSGIQLGYFIRSSDNKPSYKITYNLKNPSVASNIEALKKQFNDFIPSFSSFHASKEPIFKQLQPLGSLWASQLFTDDAGSLLNESSIILKKSVTPKQFLKITSELQKTYGKPVSMKYVRSQYYEKFSDVPESVSLFYIASFSNQNKLMIRISMLEQDKDWVLMGLQYQKTNA